MRSSTQRFQTEDPSVRALGSFGAGYLGHIVLRANPQIGIRFRPALRTPHLVAPRLATPAKCRRRHDDRVESLHPARHRKRTYGRSFGLSEKNFGARLERAGPMRSCPRSFASEGVHRAQSWRQHLSWVLVLRGQSSQLSDRKENRWQPLFGVLHSPELKRQHPRPAAAEVPAADIEWLRSRTPSARICHPGKSDH
jgi:hypothetical protein